MKQGHLRFFTHTLLGRLLLLTSVPLILLTTLLTFKTISDEQLKVSLEYYDLGLTTTEYLAATSDFALYSGNEQLLDNLARSMSSLAQIDGVTFLNAHRKILVSTLKGKPPWPELQSGAIGLNPLEINNRLYFERPVSISDIEIEDYAGKTLSAEEPGDVMGWVIVAIDMSAIEAERQAIIIRNSTVAIGFLALAFLLSFALGRGLVSPIKSLTSRVEEIERGNLNVKADVVGVEELMALGRGINFMAESIADSQRGLEQRVSSATSRLRMLLEDLQAKNTELKEERQKAEEATQAKSDFLARMSHELRTPLNAIQGFVRLLEKSNLEVSERQYCVIIEQAAEQLLLLIDDILEHARLQSGAMEFDIQPLDIVVCIENPVRLLGPSAYEKNIEVIVDVAPDLPVLLYGDSLRLRQLVSNLLANAIKFTEHGYILVRLAHQGIFNNKVMLVLEVEDTGIGMSQAQQDKIFEAFTQADTTITRRFGGTGLGLSIVQALVALMDGEITLQSEASVGTTFRVALPLELHQGCKPLNQLSTVLAAFDPLEKSRRALDHALQRITDSVFLYDDFELLAKDLQRREIEVIIISLPMNVFAYSLADMLVYLRQYTQVPVLVFLPARSLRDKPAFNIDGVEDLEDITYLTKPWASTEFHATYQMLKNGSLTRTQTALSLLNIKVLVAEDNVFSQLLLSTLLERVGCELVMVENGHQVLEVCRNKEFDILVLDVHMPELNGIDALAEIRTSGGVNAQTPALLLTADVLQHEDSLSLLEGKNKIMHKPFDERRLIELMADLVGREKDKPTGRISLLRKIPLEQFFLEVDKLLFIAVNAYKNRDITELRETVHQLLGIAGVFKLGELEKQVQALHTLVKEEDAWVGDALLAIEEELARLKAEAEAEEEEETA